MRQVVEILAPRSVWQWLWKPAILMACVVLFEASLAALLPSIGIAVDHQPKYWMTVIVGAPFVLLAFAVVAYLDRLQSKLVHLALTDMLTGLPNRWAFIEAVSAMHEAEGTVLMILDIDHFKRINDNYGHDVGDACLREAARFLERRAPEASLLARIGGEEFALEIAADCPIDLSELGGMLADGFDVALGQTGERQAITLSVGAARWRFGDNWQDVMRRADVALYQAKAEGRARLVVFCDQTGVEAQAH